MRRPRKAVSGRERECLILAARGLTANEIGETIHISDKTVKQYLYRVRSGFHVPNTTAAVVRALAEGYISMADVFPEEEGAA
jgi:two-component system response regulator DegU